MRTGVVVVTYNSAGVIGPCLDSCAQLPVVVVDNASEDDTCREVRERSRVKLIANPGNRGFAGAVNQGVAALDTELILLLNPDVMLETSVAALETACSLPNTAAAGGQLRNERGQAQTGFTLRRFPTPWTLIFETLGINRLAPANPVNRRYRCLDADLSRDQEAEQPPGALLMFRRDVWQRLGGFDTQFAPVWFEDVDFCRRVRGLGMKIQYVAGVTARHQGGHSIAKLSWACRELCWYASLLKYASKHYRPYASRGVSAAVVLASTFRAGLAMVRERSFRPIPVYARIARLAGRSCLSGRVGEIQCWTGLKKRVV
ncbi:MAG TPA: glycosyltransferase family 2 protein [Bryobacteraceae bacterium]|nr:glycosyltransferase family 2 protein [Bryobacteraceae bacterium]